MLDDRQRVSFRQTRLIRRFAVLFQRVSREFRHRRNRQVLSRERERVESERLARSHRNDDAAGGTLLIERTLC